MIENNSIYDLSKILGHSSVKMTKEKYAYLHQDHLKRVNQKICFMPNESSGNNPTIPPTADRGRSRVLHLVT
ncbi:MAG: hypothetical protein HQK49_13095 [Oligoflexia bacterium]|nr:hypothetical protein [Oligoflexia bacterium]